MGGDARPGRQGALSGGTPHLCGRDGAGRRAGAPGGRGGAHLPAAPRGAARVGAARRGVARSAEAAGSMARLLGTLRSSQPVARFQRCCGLFPAGEEGGGDPAEGVRDRAACNGAAAPRRPAAAGRGPSNGVRSGRGPQVSAAGGGRPGPAVTQQSRLLPPPPAPRGRARRGSPRGGPPASRRLPGRGSGGRAARGRRGRGAQCGAAAQPHAGLPPGRRFWGSPLAPPISGARETR